MASRKFIRPLGWGGLSLGAVICGLWLAGLWWPRDEAVPQPAASSVWVVEDGVMAWRPASAGQQLVGAILTMGASLSSADMQGRKMPGADVSSFRGLTRDYGVDASAVWYRGQRLDAADASSFHVADFGFAWDDSAIWQGSSRVADNPEPGTQLQAHSASIYSLGQSSFYHGQPMKEVPLAPPVHYCRDWHLTNKALWRGAARVATVGETPKLVSCDNSALRRNGVEDISENEGIVLSTGNQLFRFKLDNGQDTLASFDSDIQRAEPFRIPGYWDQELVMLQLDTGEVVLIDLLMSGGSMQSLGTLPADVQVNLDREGEFWLGETVWFPLSQDAIRPGEYLKQGGANAQIMGDYLLLDDNVYHWGAVLATAGALPVQSLSSSQLLIGDMCVNFGRYVTDLPDGFTDRQVYELCDVHRRPNPILYAGLEIGFREAFQQTEGADVQGLIPYHLGEVYLRNVTSETIELAEDFVASVDFKVSGGSGWVSVAVDRPEATGGRYIIPAGTSLAWPITIRSTDTDPFFGYLLEGQHSAERAAIFPGPNFEIGHGQLP